MVTIIYLFLFYLFIFKFIAKFKYLFKLHDNYILILPIHDFNTSAYFLYNIYLLFIFFPSKIGNILYNSSNSSN